MKNFICVQGSPKIPKGTVAKWDSHNKCYAIYNQHYNDGELRIDSFENWQVENNDCWEEVVAQNETPSDKFEPRTGQMYYYIDEDLDINVDTWINHWKDELRLEYGNLFPSEMMAQDELSRRKSIASAWVPKIGEDCFEWRFDEKRPAAMCYTAVYSSEAYIGAIHKTKGACEEWGNKYGDLFYMSK